MQITKITNVKMEQTIEMFPEKSDDCQLWIQGQLKAESMYHKLHSIKISKKANYCNDPTSGYNVYKIEIFVAISPTLTKKIPRVSYLPVELQTVPQYTTKLYNILFPEMSFTMGGDSTKMLIKWENNEISLGDVFPSSCYLVDKETNMFKIEGNTLTCYPKNEIKENWFTLSGFEKPRS